MQAATTERPKWFVSLLYRQNKLHFGPPFVARNEDTLAQYVGGGEDPLWILLSRSVPDGRLNETTLRSRPSFIQEQSG